MKGTACSISAAGLAALAGQGSVSFRQELRTDWEMFLAVALVLGLLRIQDILRRKVRQRKG